MLSSLFVTRVTRSRAGGEAGFSLIDILAVVALIGIVSATALPMTASSMAAFRIRNDAQAIRNLVSLAKMRAGSRFSRARVYADLAANTYRLEVFDRTTNSWAIEGAAIPMSTGVRFGFGVLAAPPPNTQNAIGFAPACTDNAGAVVANSSCIVFNSRGVPIQMTAPVGQPTGNNAFYVTDGSAVYATTVTTTPLIRFWWSPASAAAWVQR
jgi:type II secretory pathway pseudopilin PulG